MTTDGPPPVIESFRIPLITAWPPPDCYRPEGALLDAESMLAWGVTPTKLGDEQFISLARDIIDTAQAELGMDEVRGSIGEMLFAVSDDEVRKVLQEWSRDGTIQPPECYESLVVRMRLFMLVADHRQAASESNTLPVDTVRGLESTLKKWLDVLGQVVMINGDVPDNLEEDTISFIEELRTIRENQVVENR